MDRWLAEGPLSVEQLSARAVAAGLLPPGLDADGFGPEDTVEDLLTRSDAYWSAYAGTDDEIVVLASSFLETGMTFTHRVTAEDVEAEALLLAPDLSVLDWSCRDQLRLADGDGSVFVDYSDGGADRLTGPSGWIDAVRPDDVLVFRRVDGTLSVEILEHGEIGDGHEEIRALQEAAAGWIGGGRGEEEAPLVMEAMARDPSLFRRPVPPLGELLTAAGLERRSHEWGWADEVWQTRQERFARRDQEIRRLYGFDDCCDRAFDRVDEAWLQQLRPDAEAVDARSLADDLGHGAVAAAFVHAHAAAAESVAAFAEQVAGQLRGRRQASPLALLGLARLRTGDAVAAVAALQEALSVDSDCLPAAHVLVDLQLDRGDLSAAHALAFRTGVEPDLSDWIEQERARRSALRPTAARNDPCPCGSGRKFKQCCMHLGRLALTLRVPLILQRVSRYATGPEGHATLFGLAISAADSHDDLAAAIRRFQQEPLLIDIALHEGGLGEAYLEQRSALLPNDEVELLEALLEERRRLWEVTAVTPGRSLTLRDTKTGDEITVSERSGSMGRTPGDLLLARAATVEGEPMLFGVPLLVPLRQRDHVLSMLDDWVDAHGLASWFGSLFLPPRITNRDGDDLVLHRATIHLNDNPDTAIAALDDLYERYGDDLVWHETAIVDEQDRVIRSVLRLEERQLIVETNSEERHNDVVATLEDVFDCSIVETEVLEISFDPSDDEGDAGTDVTDNSEDLTAAAERNIIEYEQRWVEEAIPALAGLTPRQALDDPTRREDLFALLRELRSHEPPRGAVGMSADRLEQLLGIDRP